MTGKIFCDAISICDSYPSSCWTETWCCKCLGWRCHTIFIQSLLKGTSELCGISRRCLRCKNYNFPVTCALHLYRSASLFLFCFVLFFSFCSIVTLPVCFFVFVFIEWLYFSKTSYRSMSRTSIDQRKTYGKEKRRKENHKNKETITFSYVFRPFIDHDFLLFSYFRNGWHSHLSTNLYSLNTVQFILLIHSRHLLVKTELIARYSWT